MRRRRRRLVWTLSAVVMVTVVLVIGATSLVGSFLTRHFALETARSGMHLNSVSLLGAIDSLMMSRNNSGVRDLIADVSRGSEVYRDISLISHPVGEVAVSRLMPAGTVLDMDSESCALCHAEEGPPYSAADPLDVVHREAEGGRVLHVVTPILNRPDCRAASCHAHDDSGPLLGFLKTDYSIARVDTLIRRQYVLMALAGLLALILATAGMYIVYRRLLDRPVRSLFKGLAALAANDLSFRFQVDRDDEIGFVENTFNRMAERIQAHQSDLRRTMETLEGIVENSADLIITVDPGGIIRTFNRGAEHALGYRREEVIGKRIEMLFADPRERDTAIRRLRERDNVTNYEARFLTKDGEIRHVLLTLSRLRDRKGNPRGTFGISKDVTYEKELQRKLLRAEQIAAIGRAVTGIQHAIKNMLNSMRGGLYVAEVGHKKGDENLFGEGCKMLKEGLSRVADLSLHMLNYAREWTIDPEPTDLNELASKVESVVNQNAQDRGVIFRTEGDPSLPPVPLDPRLIHMVLMDLVTNALDACDMRDYGEDEKPEVLLSASRGADDDHVVIAVRDNGVGMTPEMVEHIFTPFVSHKKGGTGLGLSLAARIVTLHEGTIRVESQPDRGAAFRITLPVKGLGTDQEKDNGQENHHH